MPLAPANRKISGISADSFPGATRPPAGPHARNTRGGLDTERLSHARHKLGLEHARGPAHPWAAHHVAGGILDW